MGQQVFKNENFYIDETKSNYIEQLQTMYQKRYSCSGNEIQRIFRKII